MDKVYTFRSKGKILHDLQVEDLLEINCAKLKRVDYDHYHINTSFIARKTLI